MDSAYFSIDAITISDARHSFFGKLVEWVRQKNGPFNVDKLMSRKAILDCSRRHGPEVVQAKPQRVVRFVKAIQP